MPGWPDMTPIANRVLQRGWVNDEDIPTLGRRALDHTTSYGSPSEEEEGLALQGGSVEQPANEPVGGPDTEMQRWFRQGSNAMGQQPQQSGPGQWQGEMPDLKQYDLPGQAKAELNAKGITGQSSGWGKLGRFGLGLIQGGLAKGVNDARYGAQQEYNQQLGSRVKELQIPYELRSQEIQDRGRNAQAFKDYAQGQAALHPQPKGKPQMTIQELLASNPELQAKAVQIARETGVSVIEAASHFMGGAHENDPFPASLPKPVTPPQVDPLALAGKQAELGIPQTTNTLGEGMTGRTIKKAEAPVKINTGEAGARAKQYLRSHLSPEVLAEVRRSGAWNQLAANMGLDPNDASNGALFQKIGQNVDMNIPIENTPEFQALEAKIAEAIMNGQDPSNVQVPTNLGGPPTTPLALGYEKGEKGQKGAPITSTVPKEWKGKQQKTQTDLSNTLVAAPKKQAKQPKTSEGKEREARIAGLQEALKTGQWKGKPIDEKFRKRIQAALEKEQAGAAKP